MVGVAVVGAGNWGKNLVRNFAALPGADVEDADFVYLQTTVRF